MPEEVNQETFTVTLTGAGIDIKREVSATKLAHVLRVVMGDDLGEGAVLGTTSPAVRPERAKVSLREFLDDAKATTKPDQIVAIGHYMAVHEGKDTFSRDHVKARFQAARERLPANFPRDFSSAIAKGLIAEDHAKRGEYYVTKTGVQAIERHFGAAQ